MNKYISLCGIIIIICILTLASFSSVSGFQTSYKNIKFSDIQLFNKNEQNNNDKLQREVSNLDIQFIFNITANLSDIIFDVYDEENGEIAKGRAFGTIGEHRAAEIIYKNMTLLGLNTTLEQLGKRPRKPNDDIISKLEVLDYEARINNKVIDCYIAPSWKGLRDNPKQLDYNCSYNGLKIKHLPKFPCKYNKKLAQEKEDFVFITKNQCNDPNGTLPVVDLFKPILNPLKFYMLFHVTSSFNIFCQTAAWYRFYPHCKGVILYDFNKECHDMIYYSKEIGNSLPILFINGAMGKKILENIESYTIDFNLSQRYNTSVISYNVIGELEGLNKDKIIIISCLYDSWWCQGTADSAIGMGIVLAIAKYFNEFNIKPNYTIKFIAFSGEEYGFRGSEYYEDIHKNENIVAVIDLNQVGFTQEKPRLSLNIVSNRLSFLNKIWKVVERSNYVERTGNVSDIHKVWWPSGTIPGNAISFATNRLLCYVIGIFKDGGWILHHRDGMNHTEGDVLKYFNWTDVRITSEIILNITKYLTLDEQIYVSNQQLPFIKNKNLLMKIKN